MTTFTTQLVALCDAEKIRFIDSALVVIHEHLHSQGLAGR